MSFTREQHERGPVHYSCTIEETTVIELYPKGARDTSGLRLGFTLRSDQDLVDRLVELGGKVLADHRPRSLTVFDPDGHTLDLMWQSEE